MNKGRRESKRGSRSNEKNDSDSDYTDDSNSDYSDDSDYEYTIMTPTQRLREAIRSKQQDRRKGTYQEKENMDE